MKWLVTAFEPFAGAQTNSSLIVAQELARRASVNDVHFHFPLPVEFARAFSALEEGLELFPGVDGVLALGQTESRARIGLERVSLNFMNANIADNAGFKPEESRIQEGPEVHWSNIPWPLFVRPELCEFSYSAGTFVCNTVFYQIMEWSVKNKKSGGFIHIPVLESQREFAHVAQMPDLKAIDALEKVLEFLTQL